MRDTQLYTWMLSRDRFCNVMDVDLDLPHDEVQVQVARGVGPLHCPECGEACPGYGKRERRCRHLDTCQY